MQNRGYNQGANDMRSYERGNGNYQHGYKSQGFSRDHQPKENYGEHYNEHQG